MSGSDQLTVDAESDGDATVLHFAGELDLATADRLRSAIEAALAEHHRLRVDLSGVTFIDSYGLRVLVSAHGVVPAGSGAFDIVDASPQVRRTFTVTGLDVAYRWPSERR